MSKVSDSAGGGFGIGTILLVAFIILKLAEVGWFATASWLWAPVFWMGPVVAIVSIILAGMGVVAMGATIVAFIGFIFDGKKL